MKIEMWPIGKPKPYEKNPRNNSKAIAPVAESIKTFGFRQPIVVDEKGVIIVGHTRLLAAQQLGLKEVPVHVAKMSKTEAKAYRIADNRLNEIAKWEMGSLSDEIKELKGLNFDITKLGFKEIELNKLVERDEAEIERENSIPEKVSKRCKLGDIWIMGDHRLYIGNSCESSSIDSLIKKEKIHLCFTSPPYNQGGGKGDLFSHGKKVESLYEHAQDNMTDEEYKNFIIGFMVNALPHMDEVHSMVVNIAYNAKSRDSYGRIIFSDDNPFKVKETITWKKTTSINLNAIGIYSRLCEMVFVMSAGNSYRTSQQRGEARYNFWDIDNTATSKEGHKAAFPVDFAQRGIIEFSHPGDIVYEPFCGTGTTIIAAEKTGRKCRGIELSPKYGDIIVKRWEEYTGRKAKLENKK